MVDARPYGDLSIVKEYTSNVKGIGNSTYTNVMARQATDIEAAFHMNGASIDSGYVYLNLVKEYVELKTACSIHLMYGDPNDAKFFCDQAEKKLEKLILQDDTLGQVTEGKIAPIIPDTSPSNPFGHRLEGRSALGRLPQWITNGYDAYL